LAGACGLDSGFAETRWAWLSRLESFFRLAVFCPARWLLRAVLWQAHASGVLTQGQLQDLAEQPIRHMSRAEPGKHTTAVTGLSFATGPTKLVPSTHSAWTVLYDKIVAPGPDSVCPTPQNRKPFGTAPET
jgi:hypothetical protein